jgi:hypothetical protein
LSGKRSLLGCFLGITGLLLALSVIVLLDIPVAPFWSKWAGISSWIFTFGSLPGPFELRLELRCSGGTGGIFAQVYLAQIYLLV